MKKLLLLPFLLLLFSCSSEDAPNDPIVGHWQLNSRISFPENAQPVENEVPECYKQETRTFKNNGELYSVHYYMNEIMECKLNESATRTYKWTKVSEEIYNLKSTSPEGRDIRFSFPDKNTMWMYDSGPYEVDGVKYSADVEVYKRK
ncbi:hypothetical protein [Salinimicrobium sp. HB62]|uniref:hypothetical protein n=1 Tax=Salinimicrobium sp. HB62 TaxID=3077781 RepID=UPI002D776D05|nr:hypothetical protein [Salinimicrobium sp. HB62]